MDEQPGESFKEAADEPEQDDHQMDEHQMLEEFAAQLPNPELPPDMDLGKVEEYETNWTKVTKSEVTDFFVRGAEQNLSAKEETRRLCTVSGMSEERTKAVLSELFSPPRVNGVLASRGVSGSRRRNQLRPHRGPDRCREADCSWALPCACIGGRFCVDAASRMSTPN